MGLAPFGSPSFLLCEQRRKKQKKKNFLRRNVVSPLGFSVENDLFAQRTPPAGHARAQVHRVRQEPGPHALFLQLRGYHPPRPAPGRSALPPPASRSRSPGRSSHHSFDTEISDRCARWPRQTRGHGEVLDLVAEGASMGAMVSRNASSLMGLPLTAPPPGRKARHGTRRRRRSLRRHLDNGLGALQRLPPVSTMSSNNMQSLPATSPMMFMTSLWLAF